ncbi:insulinase family protein [Streptomyces sp. NPDC001922]|uniref:M16 family metallopeptidase n=1 Tax=Streptomyces sp. NPDC001922 TaxID=3364624 RepID=UPI00369A44D3
MTRNLGTPSGAVRNRNATPDPPRAGTRPVDTPDPAPTPASASASAPATVPVRIPVRGGGVVIDGRVDGGTLSAVTLALPLTTAGDRAAAVAAPLIAACWARAVARAARRSGAAIRAEPVVTADCVGVTVECVRSDGPVLHAVPEWFAEGVGQGPDPEPDFEEAKAECLARLTADDRWSDGVRRALFGGNHPYAIGHDERAAAVAAVGPDSVRRLSATLRADRPVLAASHADPTVLQALVAAVENTGLAAALDTGTPPPPAIMPTRGTSPTDTAPTSHPTTPGTARARHPTAAGAGTHTTPASRQTREPAPATTPRPVTVSVPAGPGSAYHLLGTPGVPLSSPDKPAVHLAWALLGGRGGLLDQHLRTERALTYSLAAFSREFAHGGYGLVAAGCAPETLPEVAAGTRAVISGLAHGEFSDDLLASAKERLVIQYHRAGRSSRGITERLCGYEVAGLAPAESTRYPYRLLQVTAHQVQQAAEQYLLA